MVNVAGRADVDGAQLAAVALVLMSRRAGLPVTGAPPVPPARCAGVHWLRPERVSALGGARGWAVPPHPAERA
ncbi:hypothetical protein KIH74_31070 [Kineosporia sp. J2-2]|uniref:Uncharacterized protein n=1 Tax=Kineosporia corallincola TaxID=2835133 RepID=A0ABS5TRK8_9ACTN|nr:hypothetical protein [Kineosporia corallincola]MBT0773429.1 hypothetical protein [Kineosporia corallincola]